jgi:hypothetical protein
LKAYWGVFNQFLNLVAQYDYNQRITADRKAKELEEKKNSPHFVQIIKKPE